MIKNKPNFLLRRILPAGRSLDANSSGIPAHRINVRMILLEWCKTEMRTKLGAAPDANGGVHPYIGKFYRERVAQLRETLRSDDTRSDATENLRRLIETITLEIDGIGNSQISIHESLAGTLSLSKTKKAASIWEYGVQQIKLVAGAYNQLHLLFSSRIIVAH